MGHRSNSSLADLNAVLLYHIPVDIVQKNMNLPLVRIIAHLSDSYAPDANQSLSCFLRLRFGHGMAHLTTDLPGVLESCSPSKALSPLRRSRERTTSLRHHSPQPHASLTGPHT